MNMMKKRLLLPGDTGREKKMAAILPAICLLGLVVFSFYLCLQEISSIKSENQFLRMDAREYISLADNLYEGKGYRMNEGLCVTPGGTAFRAPGYPVFLLFFRWLYGKDKFLMAVILYQNLFFCLLPLIFYWLTLHVSSSRLLSLFSAFLCAFFEPLRIMANIIHPESLAFFLLLFALGFLFSYLAEKRIYKLLAFSFFLASAVMVKQNLLLVLLVFLFPLPLMLKRRATIIAFFFPLLFFSAWLVRNSLVLHKFPVFSTITGFSFYLGHHPDVHMDMSNVTGYKSTMNDLFKQGMTEVEADRHLWEKGIMFITGKGLIWYFYRMKEKIGVLFRDYYPLAKNGVFFGLLPFAFLMKKRRRALVLLIILQIIYAFFVYAPRFSLYDFSLAGVLDIAILNLFGIGALLVLAWRKNMKALLVMVTYMLILLPMIITIPSDRDKIVCDALLIIGYALAPMVLKEMVASPLPEFTTDG